MKPNVTVWKEIFGYHQLLATWGVDGFGPLIGGRLMSDYDWWGKGERILTVNRKWGIGMRGKLIKFNGHYLRVQNLSSIFVLRCICCNNFDNICE